MNYRLHTHFSAGDSLIHRLDPRTKIIVTLCFTILVVSTPPNHLLAFVVFAGLLSWVVAAARIPLLHIVWRAAAVLPFSVLAACWLPFLREGPVLQLGQGLVELSVTGLWLFVGVVIKSFLGASAAILLASVTPFHVLLTGLRRLHMPAILVDMLTLTYRYLFVLWEEAVRLRRAAAARGYRPRWLGQALLVGRLIGQLFMRSYERAERVYGAMVLRGYRGEMPIGQTLRLSTLDLIILAFVPTLLVGVRTLLR